MSGKPHKYDNFNSIKVRLERHAESAKLLQLLFQFHKGTIRTFTLNSLFIHLLKFQFHKGTIRTSQTLGFVFAEHHFNSIKVRLEHQMQQYYTDFMLFQFHKGTIRTM